MKPILFITLTILSVIVLYFIEPITNYIDHGNIKPLKYITLNEANLRIGYYHNHNYSHRIPINETNSELNKRMNSINKLEFIADSCKKSDILYDVHVLNDTRTLFEIEYPF